MSFAGSSPAGPGIWSGVAGDIANPGLGGGGGLGSVATDHRVTDRPSGWSAGAPEFIDQGQMKHEADANATVRIAYSFDSRIRSAWPRLPTGEGQLLFERANPETRMTGRLAGNRPGAWSSTGEVASLSGLNHLLYSEAGRLAYPGRNAAEVLDEWRFIGVQTAGKAPETGARTVDVAKMTDTFNVWAHCGVEVRDSQSLWLVLTKRYMDGPPGTALPAVEYKSTATATASEEFKSSDLATQRRMILRAEIDAQIAIATAQCPAPSRVSAGFAGETATKAVREYWVFVPVICDPGHGPDIKLYMNSHVTGGIIRIGRMMYYSDRYTKSTAVHRANARAAVFPKTADGDAYLKPLLDLPKIHLELLSQ